MKYSEMHRQEREAVIDERGYQCEVSGEVIDIECHHVQPRYLDGPDNRNNYQLLQHDIHAKVHKVTGTEHGNLLNSRKAAKKRLLKDPYNEKQYEHLCNIDAVLIPEYVSKLVNELPNGIRDIIVEQTIISNFNTIRDMALTILQLRNEIENIKNA